MLMTDDGLGRNRPYTEVIPSSIDRGWTPHTVVISAALEPWDGQTLIVVFRYVVTDSHTVRGGVGLDQVSLMVETAAPVAAPEPVSLGMLRLGLAGLALTRRRPDRSA